MNPPKRKNTFMDKFVFKISKNDDDRSTTDDQKSTPTLTSLDTKCVLGIYFQYRVLKIL